MRIYVVVGEFKYDGHDLPFGVFSTEELAGKCKNKVSPSYDYTRIIEYVIDEDKKCQL